jgi:hypothetical protein
MLRAFRAHFCIRDFQSNVTNAGGVGERLERQQPEVVIEIDRMPQPFSKRISHTLDLG